LNQSTKISTILIIPYLQMFILSIEND